MLAATCDIPPAIAERHQVSTTSGCFEITLLVLVTGVHPYALPAIQRWLNNEQNLSLGPVARPGPAVCLSQLLSQHQTYQKSETSNA